MTAETGTQIQKLEKLFNAGVIMAGPTYNPVDL
jgi:microsomal dipeptidase-like Zn-dependent dipeptidase